MPAIAAFFALANRMTNFLSVRPNDKFFMIGREAKKKG